MAQELDIQTINLKLSADKDQLYHSIFYSKEKNQYYMDEVDHLYSSYQEEQRRLKEFKQKIDDLKKTA